MKKSKNGMKTEIQKYILDNSVSSLDEPCTCLLTLQGIFILIFNYL